MERTDVEGGFMSSIAKSNGAADITHKRCFIWGKEEPSCPVGDEIKR